MRAAKVGEIFDGLDELDYAFALNGDGADDWRPPAILSAWPIRPLRHLKQRDQLPFGPLDAFAVGLVDDEDVADLHNARLDRLNVIAHSRYEHDDRNVGGLHDVHFVLSDADGFDQRPIVSGGFQNRNGVNCRARQPTQIAPRRHRANEDA